MRSFYYLHGDQEGIGLNNFYCKKCDIFSEKSHFEDVLHEATANNLIRIGLKYLAYSEKSLRPDNWPNLFDKNLLIELDANLYPARGMRRKAINPTTRFLILKRDKYRCQICGRKQSNGITLHIDHRIAVAKGGTNDIKNLWTLCSECNLGKGTNNL